MGNSKNLLYRNSENVLWRSIGGELQLKFNWTELAFSIMATKK
jgi:hypothetical protein